VKLSKLKTSPVVWAMLVFLLAQVLTFIVITREDIFLANNNIYVPTQPSGDVVIWPGEITQSDGTVITVPAQSSLGPILIYFLATAAAMGLIFAVIPVSKLKLVLRGVFSFLFAWSTFIILIFWLPLWVTLTISALIGVSWFLWPRIWLHNLVLIFAMVALGAVFGHFISPWTVTVLLLVLAVYDIIAVRFGFMVFLAKKMSQATSLPAFVLPRRSKEWLSSLKSPDVTGLVDEKPVDRKFSILGGGDVGFPIILVASVYFATGLHGAIVVAAFTFIGLSGAYWIQAFFLKGRPMPALPPIAIMALGALLLVT